MKESLRSITRTISDGLVLIKKRKNTDCLIREALTRADALVRASLFRIKQLVSYFDRV